MTPVHGSRGPRDAFAAFVCDDPMLDVLRPVVNDLGWEPTKCQLGDVRVATQALAVAASPSILVVDLSESQDAFADLNDLAEVCEPGTLVIALGRTNDVGFYRELMLNGIHDYLLKPVAADQLHEALASAQLALSDTREPAHHADVSTHVACAMVGVRGGCGTSTLATAAAWTMAEKYARTTAIFDLDIHFGTDALALDLEPGRGLTDAIENPERIDGLYLERALVRAGERLSVLSAEASIDKPVLSDSSAYSLLLEEMRYGFDVTVVDLPRHTMIRNPAVVDLLDVIALVVPMTLAAARDTIRLLAWIKAHAPNKAVLVIAGRVSAAAEISQRDFEQTIERKIDIVVREDTRLFVEAAKQGKSVAEIGKNHALNQALDELAIRLLPDAIPAGGADAAVAGGKARGWLARLKLGALLNSRRHASGGGAGVTSGN